MKHLLLLLVGHGIVGLIHGRPQKTDANVDTRAPSDYQNCNCQCNSDTWTDGIYIRGNCKSKDKHGALFCYVSGDALCACRDVQISSFLHDSNSNPKYYSYEACTTPKRNECYNSGWGNFGAGDFPYCPNWGSGGGGWGNSGGSGGGGHHHGSGSGGGSWGSGGGNYGSGGGSWGSGGGNYGSGGGSWGSGGGNYGSGGGSWGSGGKPNYGSGGGSWGSGGNYKKPSSGGNTLSDILDGRIGGSSTSTTTKTSSDAAGLKPASDSSAVNFA